MFTAPTALRMFMRYGEAYPAKYDLTSLRVIACAGEPLNPEAWRWAQTYLAGDGKWGYVVDNWWQTELGGPALGTPPTMAVRPGKVGVALEGSEADVVDEQGKSVPPGVGGRLVLRRHVANDLGRPRAIRTRLATDSRLLRHRRCCAER
jgi:acetyl-CoA synthetase